MKVLKGKLRQRWNAWCAVVGKETKSRNGCVSERRKMDINKLPQQGAVTGELTERMMMMMKRCFYVHRNGRLIKDRIPGRPPSTFTQLLSCLLYTSDAADER